jgi:hypothetical protein
MTQQLSISRVSNSRNTALPMIFTLAIGAAGCGALLALFSPAFPVVSKSLAIIALMSTVIFDRYRKYGFVDPVGTFALAFLMYHGLFLFSVGLQGSVALDAIYPLTFSLQTFSDAANLSLAAAIGIVVAAFVGSRASARTFGSEIKIDVSDTPVIAGVVCLMIGSAFTYLDFQQRGGFAAVLGMGRENRYQSAGFEGFSWPFGAFIAAGLAWLAVAQATKRTPFRVTAIRIAFVVFGLLFLVLGDRRPLVQAIISALAASAAFTPELARLTKRKVAFALVAYSLIAFYATFRGEIPKLIAGAITSGSVMTTIQGSDVLDSMKPEKTDAAGPYLSVLESQSRLRCNLPTLSTQVFTMLQLKKLVGASVLSRRHSRISAP